MPIDVSKISLYCCTLFSLPDQNVFWPLGTGHYLQGVITRVRKKAYGGMEQAFLNHDENCIYFNNGEYPLWCNSVPYHGPIGKACSLDM